MKKLLAFIVPVFIIALGAIVWYAQNASTNHQSAVIARSETTKQSRSNDTATTTPPTTNTNTGTNAQNHNTTTDTAIRYNADGSIDTSNWQEYCNQEYGFCVKYPQGWATEWVDGTAGTGMNIVAPYDKSCVGTNIGCTDAYLSIFPISGFYAGVLGNNNVNIDEYDTVVVNNRLLLHAYGDDFHDGNYVMCGNNIKYAVNGVLHSFELVHLPRNWQRESNITSGCSMVKYEVVMKTIFNSLRFTKDS